MKTFGSAVVKKLFQFAGRASSGSQGSGRGGRVGIVIFLFDFPEFLFHE